MKTPRHLQNLEEAYVYATEVQLVQLREIALRGDSSVDPLSRQRAICLGMLRWCASILVDQSLVDWGTQQRPSFPYVSEVLAGDSVEWIERTADAERRYSSEPGAGTLKRLWIDFLSILPIEWLL